MNTCSYLVYVILTLKTVTYLYVHVIFKLLERNGLAYWEFNRLSVIWIISYSCIVSLQQVAKTTKSSEMTTEEKKRILDAIGLTFLIRLLKSGTHSGSHKFLIMSTHAFILLPNLHVWFQMTFRFGKLVKIIMKCLYIFVILHNFVKPFIIFIDICFKVYF